MLLKGRPSLPLTEPLAELRMRSESTSEEGELLPELSLLMIEGEMEPDGMGPMEAQPRGGEAVASGDGERDFGIKRSSPLDEFLELGSTEWVERGGEGVRVEFVLGGEVMGADGLVECPVLPLFLGGQSMGEEQGG